MGTQITPDTISKDRHKPNFTTALLSTSLRQLKKLRNYWKHFSIVPYFVIYVKLCPHPSTLGLSTPLFLCLFPWPITSLDAVYVWHLFSWPFSLFPLRYMLRKDRIFFFFNWFDSLMHSQHCLALSRYSFNNYWVKKELLDCGGVLMKYKPSPLNYVSSSPVLVMALFFSVLGKVNQMVLCLNCYAWEFILVFFASFDAGIASSPTTACPLPPHHFLTSQIIWKVDVLWRIVHLNILPKRFKLVTVF